MKSKWFKGKEMALAMGLEMATGQPVVYDFDEKLNVLSKEKYDID